MKERRKGKTSEFVESKLVNAIPTEAGKAIRFRKGGTAASHKTGSDVCRSYAFNSNSSGRGNSSIYLSA